MSDRIESSGHGDGEDRSAHGDRWGADLAAYALDALDGGERRAVEEHLAGCESCRERLRWMQPAVDVLPAAVAQQAPPPELKERIMEVVEREAAPAGAGDRSDAGERSSRRGFRSGGIFGGFSLRPVLAGFAVVILLAAAITGYAIRSDGGDEAGPTAVYTATAERPSSSATGRLEVEGDSGVLHVANLPPTHGGDVYQAWIQDRGSAGGSVHASSVFVVSEDGSGDVAIPHGLSQAGRVMVTREPAGGSRHPSENSLLTAEMN